MPVSASEAAYVQAAFKLDWLSLGVGLLVVTTTIISAATISVGSAGYVAVFTTAIGIGAILVLALAAPLAGLADLTAGFTLVIFTVVNLALIRIKSRNEAPPLGTFIRPRWVPFAGIVSGILLLLVDLIV